MNTRHPFDQRLTDWLEDGPADAPDQILETVLAAFPSIPQRRAALRVPWRNSSMNGYARVLAGIAAIVAIAVGALILRPGSSSSGVGTTPSVSPSPSAQASVPIGWTTYTSSRFAYTIGYPADWVATPATQDWPSIDFPDKSGQAHDGFSGTSTGPSLFVSSVPLTGGKVAADWLAELDSFNADHVCHLSKPRTITIDGVSARQEDGVCMGSDQMIEVVMANDARFYQINLFGQSGPFTDADRATLDRSLASFHFGG